MADGFRDGVTFYFVRALFCSLTGADELGRTLPCIPPPRMTNIETLCDMYTWLCTSPLRSNENERVPSDMCPTVPPRRIT